MAQASKPAATNFSDAFLAKIKVMLEAQKVAVDQQLKALTVDNDGGRSVFPDYGETEEDNAQEVADYEANLSIKDDLLNTVRDVAEALSRLEKGTYGICKYCKKPIDEKRLLARPTSSACVECKKTIVQEA